MFFYCEETTKFLVNHALYANLLIPILLYDCTYDNNSHYDHWNNQQRFKKLCDPQFFHFPNLDGVSFTKSLKLPAEYSFFHQNVCILFSTHNQFIIDPTW